MHAVKLSPSMMCVDFAKMQETVDTFAREGVEYLHVDIMDGEFVPNFTLGVDFCQKLRMMSKIPLDIHLMITKPENKLEWFAPQPGEFISVHWESTVHMQRTLAKIHSFGAKTMVALNPATPITVIEEVLEDLDAVLLMTVNPGYAGQKIVPAAFDKIRRMRTFLDERGYSHVRIEVDGNVSFENAVKMRAAGADICVAGSSSVFSKDDTIENNIRVLRQSLAE